MRKRFFTGLSTRTVSTFFVTLALCSVLIVFTVINRSNVEKLTMEQVILEKSIEITEVITKLLYKTHAVAAIVVQNNGEISDFERIAATIIDDPAILNVLIAPDGVVSNVYPVSGNEAVMGLDFFEEGAGNKEAGMAKERGELVFGGPFELVQGGQALVGRLPVYIDSQDGRGEFWGLVSVTLKYPEALNGVGLEAMESQGLAYEIWRINPDDNKKQIIANSAYDYKKNARYIEKPIQILNSEWYFRVSPARHWYEYPETWLLSIVALFASLLFAYVMQNNTELKAVKADLEEMARLDPLTEIFNRRYFMELASMQIDKSNRTNSNCYVVIFDLDHFKKINDKYGHQAGDEALKTIAVRVKGVLRSYDLLARYGGEEFIMLFSDIDNTMALSLAERVRHSISDASVEFERERLNITASLGIAQAAPANDLETAIKYADEALYRAKAEGRNKTVFYDECGGKTCREKS